MLFYIAQAMWDFTITLPEFKFKLFYDFNGWGAISFFFFNLFFKIIKAMEHFHQLVMIFSLVMIVFIKGRVKWQTYDKVSQQVQSLLGSLLNKMALWFTSYYRYVSLFVVKPYSILLVLVNKKSCRAENCKSNRNGLLIFFWLIRKENFRVLSLQERKEA